MYAGHDTHAGKESTATDGRTTPTRQGHFQKWDVCRKHEAELVSVANSTAPDHEPEKKMDELVRIFKLFPPDYFRKINP